MMGRRVDAPRVQTGASAGFAVAVLLVLGAAADIVQAQPDLSAIENHIVVVRAFDRTRMALGDISGLAVGNGLVVTSAQMLRGAEAVVVVTPGGAQEFPAELRSVDERSGIAVLAADQMPAGGARFAADNPNADPEEGDVVHVPRFAVDGSLGVVPAAGLIAELRRLEPDLQGERELLLYRHNAAVTAREYGMPMLNDCGEVVGLIRPDPDLSLRDLNDRVGPGESTFSVAGAEARRAVAELGVEVRTADTLCPDANATLVQQAARARELEDEARQAREAANTARRATEEARARAAEAQRRAAALLADAVATEAERDAAREDAELLQAAAEEQEAELDDLERRANGARAQAREAEQRVAQLEQERLRFVGALVAGAVVLLAVGLLYWRRRSQLAESEAARRKTQDRLAAAVTPASFSCLLEGADEAGRSVVLRIDAAQLGSPEGVVVGRNPERAGVVLDHPEASRRHFRMAADGDNLSIEDLDSTNGTLLNGTAIPAGRPAGLSHGDEIGVGAAVRLTLSIKRSTR